MVDAAIGRSQMIEKQLHQAVPYGQKTCPAPQMPLQVAAFRRTRP
jgi:hypothetical protein